MEQRNLILAIVVSAVIWLGFYFLYEQPRLREQQAALEAAQRAQQTEQVQQTAPAVTDTAGVPVPGQAAVAPAAPVTADRAAVIAASPRVAIDSPRLKGSIALKGGRLDDIVLKDYRTAVDPRSPNIVLLTPPGAPEAYFAEFGWTTDQAGIAAGIELPDENTEWQADGSALTADRPLTLSWDNGQGLRFSRTIAIDGNNLFTVTQRVESSAGAPTATLFPYGRVRRFGTPPVLGFFILHEGLVGVFDDLLEEVKYDEIREAGRMEFETTGGWVGITDKYWLVSIVPQQADRVKASYSHQSAAGTDVYQVDYLGGGQTLTPGASIEASGYAFAGAKEVRLLEQYSERPGIAGFVRAVDWGWFPFLTKPIFWVLDYVYGMIGNFGVAILVLTVLIKLLFFPLANKSYKAMSKMKALTPEMTKLRERFQDDKQRLNQEMMGLYKREKVNPAAGCLPIVIQIPVFFALYKVLFVTIEMRHAPFFGWIKDLSAPDPTSFLNLFGLLPWAVPDLGPLNLLSIGIWPIIMGITMYLQQKLNPAPPDPVQAKIFMMLPIVFTFMLGTFPAGLVIYWAWNNILSMAQQWVIMRRMGVKIS